MSFGRFDKRYNFSSSFPEFKPSIFKIPQNYREIIESSLKQLPSGSERSHLEALLYYMIQFGGTEIPQHKHFTHPWFDVEKKKFSRKSRVKPNRTLLNLLNKHTPSDFRFEHLQRNWSGMKVEDDLISRLNRFYSDNVRLSLPFSIMGAPANWGELCRNFQSIPFLKPSEKSGGRLFQQGVGYQMIPKRFREELTINGDKTSEIDISAAALRFLYLSGKDFGIDFPNQIILNEDSYTIFSEIGVSRDLAKELTYALVFSSKEKEERAVKRKLHSNERFRNRDDLAMVMPEFFEALEAYKEIHSAPHIPLFTKETEFTREVLRRSLDKELVLLPIHDSYITTTNRFEDFQRILREAQTHLYGDSHPLTFRREY